MYPGPDLPIAIFGLRSITTEAFGLRSITTEEVLTEVERERLLALARQPSAAVSWRAALRHRLDSFLIHMGSAVLSAPATRGEGMSPGSTAERLRLAS
jgi:hypothetical protein